MTSDLEFSSISIYIGLFQPEYCRLNEGSCYLKNQFEDVTTASTVSTEMSTEVPNSSPQTSTAKNEGNYIDQNMLLLILLLFFVI